MLIVERVLMLSEPPLREFMDLSFFVDTDLDLRLLRRLWRGLVE